MSPCFSSDEVKVEGEEEDEEMRAMLAEFEKKKAARRAQLREAQLQRDAEAQGPPPKKVKSEADVQRIVSAPRLEVALRCMSSRLQCPDCFRLILG